MNINSVWCKSPRNRKIQVSLNWRWRLKSPENTPGSQEEKQISRDITDRFRVFFLFLLFLIIIWPMLFFFFPLFLSLRSEKGTLAEASALLILVFFLFLENQMGAGYCKALKDHGRTSSGEYLIDLGGSLINVYCNMSVDGGGWTVFQRRKDGSVDFYRKWKDYENGFGDVSGEFWLGNKWIHRLTSLGTTELRIDFENGKYVKYSSFAVGNAASKYTLTVSGYSGTLQDGLTNHNNMKFSTYDQDNDITGANCAIKYKGAWWYHNCHNSNLNGMFGRQDPTGINFAGYYHNFAEMKLRRVWSKTFTRIVVHVAALNQ